MQQRVLVTGASGKTGRACVDALLARGATTRGFVRREEAADALRARGAEAALGDLFDRDALARALEGVTCALHICPPMHPQEDELAATVIDLCKAQGVGRLVLYSVMHPHADVPHHRRKLKAETTLIESGLPFTILQPCRYMH
ncbi:MAG TPA: NAD(P)H-binding protein, partial [Beijerinckiaceae bacterium]